jgi:peroxiredoxin
MRLSAHCPDVIFIRGGLIAIVISLTIVFVLSCKKKETAMTTEVPIPEVGNNAPLFSLRDINGNDVSLSDFKDKIVVVDFWATWCTWCKETTRELETIHEDYRGKNVVILGVSMNSGSSAGQKVKAFARKYNLNYVMLVDDGKVSRSYGINKIPTTFILDRGHIIRKIFPGYLPGLKERISAEIQESLAKSKT